MAVESTRLATDNIGNEEAMCLRVTIGETINSGRGVVLGMELDADGK